MGISIWLALRNKREWPQLLALGSIATVLTFGTVWWQIGEAANWRAFYRELDVAGSALIMHVNDRGNPALEQIYPESPLRSKISAWLDKERLAMFTELRASLIGMRVSAAPNRCRGAVESAVKVTDGIFRVTGWAVDTRDLVFTDASGVIVGIARSGLRRPDLKASFADTDKIGWQGYAKSPTAGLTTYGVLAGGRYCLIEDAKVK
jgi:hypothetical protein